MRRVNEEEKVVDQAPEKFDLPRHPQRLADGGVGRLVSRVYQPNSATRSRVQLTNCWQNNDKVFTSRGHSQTSNPLATGKASQIEIGKSITFHFRTTVHDTHCSERLSHTPGRRYGGLRRPPPRLRVGITGCRTPLDRRDIRHCH